MTHETEHNKYRMTISRLTIDKLGVKLYDQVSAVVAELVANAYDADAKEVKVEAPMGEMLATLSRGDVSDKGLKIVVSDTGHGMDPQKVNDFFLKVGAERRNDQERGDRTPKYKRRVMGRKGIGKLAPFGICKTLEVISSGGKKTSGEDENGNQADGYKTAHFIMKSNDIIADNDDDYIPDLGKLDGIVRPDPGTKIILRDFNRRRVPKMKTFARQLSQRFGIRSENWKIILVDSTKEHGESDREKEVGKFEIDTMAKTKISFDGPQTESVNASEKNKFTAKDEDGEDIALEAGFISSTNEKFHPVRGWVAYAKQSYRDDLMAGIRIYCRGKIAAQTAVFNRESGFQGEHSVRSYLVGELEADWLDEEEDLIQTDRRDIRWSEELGQEFQAWGKKVVDLIGKRSRDPEKKKTWDEFLEVSDIKNIVYKEFPGERWEYIRVRAMRLAKMMGERLRPAEVKDRAYVAALVQYSITLAPHNAIDDALKKAADESTTIETMVKVLRTARIAELSSYGLIAEKRVKVINRIMEKKDDDETLEHALQKSIEEAPWLLNPSWSPVTQNRSLSTFRSKFEKEHKERTGQDISLAMSTESKKRPDFILSGYDFDLQIVEIKRPNHKLTNKEWDRIQSYIDTMQDILGRKGNEEFRKYYKKFAVTLICDEIGLSGSQSEAFDSHKRKDALEHITWAVFLDRTERVHKDFLEEAERQKKFEIER